MLEGWHGEFGVKLPPVVMTDGYEGMSAALSSLTYASEVWNLNSIFHIFALNIEKTVSTDFSCGTSGWPKF